MNGVQTTLETAPWFSPWIKEFCGFGQAGAGLELLGELQATLWRVTEWPDRAQGCKAHEPCGVLQKEWLSVDPQDTGGYVTVAEGLQRESGCPCRDLQITRACGFCVKRLQNGDCQAEATRLQSDHVRVCGWGSPSIPPLGPAKSLQPPLLRKPPTVLISKEKY